VNCQGSEILIECEGLLKFENVLLSLRDHKRLYFQLSDDQITQKYY
jgi:hypothetical protein